MLPLAVAYGQYSDIRPVPSLVGRTAQRSSAASVRAETNDDGIVLTIDGLRARIGTASDRASVSHNAPQYFLPGDSATLPGLFFKLGVPYDATDIRVERLGEGTVDTLAGPFVSSLRLMPADPKPTLSLTAPTIFRGLRIVTLSYRPMRREGGRLLIDESATIRISWKRTGTTKGASPAAKERPDVERMLGTEILNFDRAQRWRVSSSSGVRTLAAIDGGMGTAMVLLVPADGLYRVTASSIAAAGGQGVDGASISALRLRHRSDGVPFYVQDVAKDGIFNGDDYIEFHGRRNQSPEGFYFDETTDTNAYILTWDNGTGSSPTVVDASGGTPGSEIRWYDSTLHFEEEHRYLLGFNLPESDGGDIQTLHVNERVKNERYYWDEVSFNPTHPSPLIVPFDCSPYYENGGTVRLRIRLAGSTFAPHPLTIHLNGETLVDSTTIGDTADVTLDYTIPVSYLVNGRNELRIDPLDPRVPIPSSFYLDYFELQGKWMPAAWETEQGVRLSSEGPAHLTVAGFSAPPTLAFSDRSRVRIDSVDRGLLFRMTSRQFPPAQRNNPAFYAQVGDTRVSSGQWEHGIKIAEISGSTGALLRETMLIVNDDNTRADEYRKGVQFLNAVATGNYVVAGFATSGGPNGGIASDLTAAFQALGSRTFGVRNSFVASWAFVARKGSPSSAVEEYQEYNQYANTFGVSLNAFLPIGSGVPLQGASYRASITLPGGAGEEYVLGRSASPGLRWHDRDQLVDGDNQADMIIISHPNYLSESQRLAQYRAESKGMNVKVVDVRTVYDEFNDGIKSAYAIRRFLQYADQTWKDPKPLYVLLMGDASLDPAMRLNGSKMVDYVPSMGNPVSDYLMTVYVGDTSMQYHQLIGRFPVKSTDEAKTMVDKLIEYESLPPDYWNKRMLFFAGGGSVAQVEEFKYVAYSLATIYVLSPVFAGDTGVVFRTSTQDLAFPDSKDAPWARAEINKGALWLTFTGHGSVDIFDLNFGYPEELDNGNRYFVLTTYSCQTGAFAEPGIVNRNERFVTYPGKGAIAAFGGTSYAYTDIDDVIKSNIMAAITQRFERTLGSILTEAKWNMFLQNAPPPWYSNVEGIKVRNHLMMYNLLGDPSMDIAVRSTRELAVREGATPIHNTAGGEPMVHDSTVVVPVRLWDYGRPIYSEGNPDSTVMVVASMVDRFGQRTFDTVWIDNLGYYRDTSLVLPLNGQPGEYTVRVEIDPGRTFAESYLDDNVLVQTFRIRGNQPLAIEPLPYGRVPGYDDVVVRLLNPTSGPGAEITVDTTDTFDSPARFSSLTAGSMKLEELTTTWTFSIPQNLRSARTFYWRAVATSGDPDVANLFPLVETFTVDGENAAEYIVAGSSQLRSVRPPSLVVDERGIGPGLLPVEFELMSIGQTFIRGDIRVPDSKTVTMRVKVGDDAAGVDYRSSGQYEGINVLVFPPNDVVPIYDRVFNFRNGVSGSDFEWFRDFVRDTIVPGERVLVAFSRQLYDPAFDLDSSAIKKVREGLKMLGSSVADRIHKEDSYVLVGGKGLDQSDVREAWVDGDALRRIDSAAPWPVVLRDTVHTVPSAAITFPTIGPAKAWGAVTFAGVGAPVDATVFGVRRDGGRDTLVRRTADASISLAGVDAKKYPRIEVGARFAKDSLQRIGAVNVVFDPSPELALVPSTMAMVPDSVLQGDPATAEATVVNLSRKYSAEGFSVRLQELRESLQTLIDSTAIERLDPNDSNRVHLKIVTDRLSGANRFQVTVNPWDIPAEPYTQNNTLEAVLRVSGDSVPPTHRIYADNTRLIDGDYVRPQPQFDVRIFDNSALLFDSLTGVRVIIDNFTEVTPRTTEWSAKLVPKSEGSDYRVSFLFRPPTPLAEGEHTLILWTTDHSGNMERSPIYTFYVESATGLRQVVNVPNPFARKTAFTFVVTGETQPVSGDISIFTVSGRKIKTIPLDASQIHVGFNSVEWDGLDGDGDRLANGVYYYRVTIDDGKSRQEVIEKLAVLR